MMRDLQRASLVIVSKDERNLDDTLRAVKPLAGDLLCEVLVIDASNGALEDIRQLHKWVNWIDYEQPAGVRVTIAHQRNIGVRNAFGEIIIFTDSGCIPEERWLERLLAPILEDGEFASCGPVKALGKSVYSKVQGWGADDDEYVPMAATINLAFRREVFDAVGGFDETFGAGEDIDFTWRLTDYGYKLRWVSDAIVQHEWGTFRRQLRRAFFYGKAASRLLRKHPHRIRTDAKDNMVPFAYSLFLIGLPLTLRWRWYPFLLLWPAWRHRNEELRWFVILHHLVMGAGAIFEIIWPNV